MHFFEITINTLLGQFNVADMSSFFQIRENNLTFTIVNLLSETSAALFRAHFLVHANGVTAFIVLPGAKGNEQR